MKLVEEWKKYSTKKKVIIGVSVLGCIGLVTAGTTTVTASYKRAEVQRQYDEKTEQLLMLDRDLDDLLDEEDPDFLSSDIQEEEIEKILEAIEQNTFSVEKEKKYKTKNYYESLNNVTTKALTINTMYYVQTEVNTLYQTKDNKVAMNGKEINKELAIADDLKEEELTVTYTTLYVEEPETKFYEAMNELLDEAKAQHTQIDTAKKEIAKVYKENKVISTDKGLYDKAKAEADKIKNEKAKKELSDKLAKVKTDIEKKEKEEAEKKASEEAKQQASETPTEATDQGVNTTAVGETSENNASATYTPTNEATYVAEENTYTPSVNTGGGATNTGNGGTTATDGGGSGSGGNTGGGSTTPQSPPGYAGPFGSEAEAIAFGEAGENGYTMMFFEGYWYVYLY